MRRPFVAVAAAAIAWAALPASNPALGVGTFAGLTMLSAGAVQAGTAIQPGWRHSCSRNPRCFERGEARRRARMLSRSMRQP